jgi:hypothetical protein
VELYLPSLCVPSWQIHLYIFRVVLKTKLCLRVYGRRNELCLTSVISAVWIFVVFRFSPFKFGDSLVETQAFFRILCNSVVTDDLFIRCHLISAIDKVVN